MKKMHDVEKTRRAYHQDRMKNSTHRASLMVPELAGSHAEISFLNHFLLKRGYTNVGCRLTAIDPEGARIESRLVPITEPKVYTIPLTGMVQDTVDSYLVEFFSADNLFIPFPAVMINHVGDGFVNSVHAYNRVLNDVFEDDDINQIHQREAAIDVRCDNEIETFLVFQAGPQAVDGVLEAELILRDGRTLTGDYSLKVPKLCHKRISIRDLFPDLALPLIGGTLKVRQPTQFMFYGRMLVGQQQGNGGAFSANHSYYDCADFAEYWENDTPSTRIYPYMPGFDNILRFYPIMSPGELEFSLDLFGAAGQRLGDTEILGEIAVPNGKDLEQSVTDILRRRGIDEADTKSFQVSARPLSGNTPTRVNHQLVYGAGGLESSINISLTNSNVFIPETKTGFSWGQMPVGDAVSSSFGALGMMPSETAGQFNLKLFSDKGMIVDRDLDIPAMSAAVFQDDDLVGSVLNDAEKSEGRYVWYQVSSKRADSNAVVVTKHRDTGHAVGEHAF